MAGIIIINIIWETIDFDFEKVKLKNTDSDYGIYQIYGQHTAYGDSETLLYIGKAEDNPFGTRLDNRWEFVESCARPTKIRLGRIVKSNKPNPNDFKPDDWRKMIGIAETLLIRSHTPGFNKVGNSGLYQPFAEENFLVLNWGDRGKLLPEVSTYRYSYDFWEHDTPFS